MSVKFNEIFNENLNVKNHDPFISDMGNTLSGIDIANDEKIKLPRYGIWKWDSQKRKFNVIETSDDLNYLKRKYNIDSQKIFKLG